MKFATYSGTLVVVHTNATCMWKHYTLYGLYRHGETRDIDGNSFPVPVTRFAVTVTHCAHDRRTRKMHVRRTDSAL